MYDLTTHTPHLLDRSIMTMSRSTDGAEPLTPTRVVPPSKKSAEKHDPPLDYYYARFGTFMLVGSTAAIKDLRQADDLVDKLVGALEADNRVSSIGPTMHRKDWTHTRTIYPLPAKGLEKDMFGKHSRLKAVALSDPLSFTVNVPIKNQPTFRGCDDIPTDTYHVAWDGITAVVLWEVDKEEKSAPQSGGHIVAEIFRDAADKIGLSLVAQPCHPGCTALFAHKLLRIERYDGKGAFRTTSINELRTAVHLHAPGDAHSTATHLLKSIGFTGETFALFKNGAYRILELEKFCRRLVDTLLGLNYAIIQWTRLPLRARMKNLKEYRARKRQVQDIIAILWLTLAEIEALRRDWLDNRRRLHAALAKPSNEHLYDRDRSGDDEKVMEQDLSFIRAAVEQTAVRSDTRMVAIATAFGAIGGLIGGLLGGLLS